ncbi:MAG: substrate-binding domain-containing protein, partial [Firmicutes bacterium]|nr:substrate-binding domain-containing protein [Bacillota bacterium]
MKDKKIIQQLELEMSKAKGVNVLADIKQAYYNDPGILKVKGDKKMKRQKSEAAVNHSRRKFFTFASAIAAGLAVIITAAVILPGILRGGNDSEAQAAYNSALSKMVQQNYLNIETNNDNSQSAYVFEKGNMVSVYSDDEAEVQWLNENGSILMDKEEELYYKNTDADISELSQNMTSVLFGSDDLSFSFGESNAINVKSQGVDYTVALENGMIKTVTPKNNPNHKKNLDYGKKGGYYAPAGIVSVFVYDGVDPYISALRNELVNLGLGVDNTFDAGKNHTRQSEQIAYAITKGTDLIIVNLVYPDDTIAAQEITNMAKEAEIPVIFFNREIENIVLNCYELACYVGMGYADAGIRQGEMIAEYLLRDENINPDGSSKYAGSDGISIKYAMLRGDLNNAYAIYRTLCSVKNAQAILDEAYANGYIVSQWKLVNAGTGLSDGWTTASNVDLDLWKDTEGNPLSETDKEIMRTFIYSDENWDSIKVAAEFSDAFPTEADITDLDKLGIIISNADHLAISVIDYLGYCNCNQGNGTYTIPVFGIDAINHAIDAIESGRMAG